MFRFDVAFGDSDEARQARLGCEQIVTARIQRTLGKLITDGEQLPRRIQKEPKLHVVKHFCGELVETFNSSHESFGSGRRLLQRCHEASIFGNVIISAA